MMTDNAKKFAEAVSKNEAMKKELETLGKNDVAAVIKVAAKHGFTLTEEDFKAADMNEMNEDELEAVAGGVCVCPYVGGGTGTGKQCACVMGGKGTNDSGTLCGCAIVGAGRDDEDY